MRNFKQIRLNILIGGIENQFEVRLARHFRNESVFVHFFRDKQYLQFGIIEKKPLEIGEESEDKVFLVTLKLIGRDAAAYLF